MKCCRCEGKRAIRAPGSYGRGGERAVKCARCRGTGKEPRLKPLYSERRVRAALKGARDAAQ